MVKKIILILGAVLVVFWGISHLFPTNDVVKGFGDISLDNIRIIRMEWINEGLTLIFIGAVILLAAFLGERNNIVSRYVILASAVMLFGMAVLSLFTGAKINFLPFRLCPVIFGSSGVLILIGNYMK
jgi:hypothetical protein